MGARGTEQRVPPVEGAWVDEPPAPRTVSIKATPTILIVGLLWVAVAVLGMTGLWFTGLLLSVVLMVLQVALGTAHKGKLDLRLLAFPILPFGVIYAGSFLLAQHFDKLYAGQKPDFTILGFHPSFAWIVLGYWLAGVAVLTLGFYFRRDLWLPDHQWEEFKQTIARLERERQQREESDDAVH